MATYGTVGEFVEGSEDWTEYEERLGHFFSANEITEEAKKRSILLSACGAKTYKLIRNLATPRKPGDIPYDELVQLVANHHNPKPSVIVQRFKFHSHFRRQGQSVANFVAELRQLSEHCDFGPVLDDMLRDRLVCGINNDATQRRLLGEAPPLTFKKALEISQGMEMAANNAKDIQKGHGGAQAAVVHQVKGETVKHAKRVECFRCGGAHYANDCKFKDAICHACSKKGHLAKKCRQEKGKRKPGAGKTHQSQAPTHHLEEEGVCSYNMFAVEVDEETDEEPPEPYYATVKVVGQDITFEVDSGATASVISEETYRKTWGSNPPPLRKSRLRLRTYTGQPIPHCGVIYVDIAAEAIKQAYPYARSGSERATWKEDEAEEAKQKLIDLWCDTPGTALELFCLVAKYQLTDRSKQTEQHGSWHGNVMYTCNTECSISVFTENQLPRVHNDNECCISKKIHCGVSVLGHRKHYFSVKGKRHEAESCSCGV
ncbi:uncharacterized protein V6R79_014960 [Siganus canaliculatus]